MIIKNMKDYKTVSREASAEIIEKKSRFIAYVRPAAREDEAVGFINEIRSRHTDASHNVYAYLCRENNVQRYSDDGEPSGTAGIPVLDVMRKELLTDICIVVTRYFGGTLLGAGGLVRAYGASAKKGIDAAGRVQMVYSEVFEVETDYSLLGRLQYEISEAGFTTAGTDFGSSVKLTVSAQSDKSTELVRRLTEASNGKAKIKRTGEQYISKNFD